MSADAMKGPDLFSTLEIDTIGEIMNISMGSAATAASTLLDNKVTITTPIVKVEPLESFDIKMLEPAVAVEIKYVEGISGSNILILRRTDVRTILAQMMQMEIEENFVIDELAESAMCELMNQMMGSSATVLSCFLGRNINISTPMLVPINGLDDFKREHFPQNDHIVTITFTLSIDNVMESEFISVMDIELAKEIIDVSLNFDSDTTDADAVSPLAPVKPEPEPEPAPPPAAQPAAAAAAPAPPAAQAPPLPAPPAADMAGVGQIPPGQPAAPAQAYPPPPAAYPPGGQQYPAYPSGQPYAYQQMPPMGYGAPVQQAAENPIVVKEFEYGDFSGGSVQEMPANMDLVMNVPVVVTVELGRTKRKIKEILEFGQGTIVELDKQAGSQVDVIVNGQLIAKGDVVVVDDNFSIRITEILKSRDSLSML